MAQLTKNEQQENRRKEKEKTARAMLRKKWITRIVVSALIISL